MSVRGFPFHSIPICDSNMSRAQSSVCIPLSHRSCSSLSVHKHRHRSFLQRVYAGVDRCPISIHRFLSQKCRRVQQRVQERQTRSHRRRYRLRMDLGRDSGLSTSPSYARIIQIPDACSALKLQSSAVAYKYGISGPWWYGSGATVQVLLFAQVRNRALQSNDVWKLTRSHMTHQLSAKLKLNAPHAYTWLEIIGARWGKLAHFVFMFFGYVPFEKIPPSSILNRYFLVWPRTSSSLPCSSWVVPQPSLISRG